MIDVRRLPSPGDGIAERIAEAVRERTALEPVAGVVLGSGLSTAVDTMRASSDGEEVEIAYADLPGSHLRPWLGTRDACGSAR
jgi:hypothetical protein